MSIPKTPIMLDDNDEFEDADGNILRSRDIARDLTEFYETKRRQEECGKTGHEKGYTAGTGYSMYHNHCPKCGADLTKGAKT